MPDPRMLTVAERLLERTKAGRLRWQAASKPKDGPDDWKPTSFVTRLQHGSATVTSEAPEGRYPYELRLREPTGQHIGELATGDEDAWLGDREPDASERALAELYSAARASALNTTASLDAIVEELSGD
jgi:hypothetical protein